MWPSSYSTPTRSRTTKYALELLHSQKEGAQLVATPAHASGPLNPPLPWANEKCQSKGHRSELSAVGCRWLYEVKGALYFEGPEFPKALKFSQLFLLRGPR